MWLLLLLFSCCLAAPCTDRAIPTPNEDNDYDFIIAGAGTAGCIVAARLASANFKVLLIESGYRLYDNNTLSAQLLTPVFTGTHSPSSTPNPLYSYLQNMPFLYPYPTMTNASHHYLVVPQIYGQKREINYPRGNIVGGSSGANALIYFRGSQKDFDEWENEYGLEGWGYTDVMRYFKKYENNTAVPNKPSVHGYSGPVEITTVQSHFASPEVDAWTKAAQKMGYPTIQDASNPQTVYGASNSWQTFTNSTGSRVDSSVYIGILDRKRKVCWDTPACQCLPEQNLHIWTEIHVTKVLIDDAKRAYGVEYAKAQGLDRTDHPKFPRSTDEAIKHNRLLYQFNKWDKEDYQGNFYVCGNEAGRLGAPVAKQLAFDYNRPYDQYIPESGTVYTPRTVTANYEVILSTGAIVTPQLLMLSGIGPKDHLREHKIPLVQDLPVGKRVNDHQEVVLTWKFGAGYTPRFSNINETLSGAPEFQKYLRGEPSFYASTQLAGGLDGSSDGPNGTVPTWHLHHGVGGAFENFDWNIASYEQTLKPPYRIPRTEMEVLGWQGLYLHTHLCELSANHAFGRIELRNKDPFAAPFVDPRWGASEEDNAELINCVKTLRELMKHTETKYAGHEWGESARAKTDQQLSQYVRNNVWGHHLSSSAPMGKCDSPYAVTDAGGRVYGVSALRVIDISIFPTIPHANPAGVVMMAAEKLVEQIMVDYDVDIPDSL